jgi:DNA-binding MarR family transcriptional regulator
MLQHENPGWAFLTNHAQVMLCIADDPGIRLREIGERVGITERAAHRIVAQLVAAAYITRERTGRRNRYTINADRALPEAIGREQNMGKLLEVLTEAPRLNPAARG